MECAILKNELSQRGLSISRFSYVIGVVQGDLSKALNGKKRFFPSWRKRASEALGIPEEELFPEYKKNILNPDEHYLPEYFKKVAQ